MMRTAPRTAPRTVILSIEGHEETAAARDWCADHCEPDDEIVAVIGRDQVAELMVSVSPLMAAADDQHALEAAAREVIAPLVASGLRCRTRLIDHTPIRALTTVAEELGAELLVIGKASRTAMSDVWHNDTASRLIHHPPCPVIVVPVPSPAGRHEPADITDHASAMATHASTGRR